MTWTEERVAELSRLWESGYSASAIGKLLGVSKNAVVGKAHRMRLSSRPSPIKREQRAPRRQPVMMPDKPKPVEKIEEDIKAIVPLPPPRPLNTRRDGKGPKCLWPLGDPGDADFHFCGAPAVHGKPYCESHCARAYITKTKNDSEAA
jgi:GcrA cell cycle regulator